MRRHRVHRETPALTSHRARWVKQPSARHETAASAKYPGETVTTAAIRPNLSASGPVGRRRQPTRKARADTGPCVDRDPKLPVENKRKNSLVGGIGVAEMPLMTK